jgi:hypothetical protein
MLYEFIFEPAPRLRQHRRKVGFRSIATLWPSADHFQSTPVNRHRQNGPVGRFGARKGHKLLAKLASILPVHYLAECE